MTSTFGGGPLSRVATGPSSVALSAIDGMAQGVCLMDVTGRITYSNPAASRMLGLSVDEMDGRTPTDPWHAVDAAGRPLPGDRLPAAVCLHTGRSVEGFVIGVPRPDGELRWLRVDSRPLHDERGAPEGVVSVFEDITAERLSAEELARSEQRLYLARRAGRVALWEWDCVTSKVWFDEHFTDVTGHPAGFRDEWILTVHADDRARVLGAFDEVLRGEEIDVVYRVTPKDGDERWISSHAVVTDRDPSGRPTRVAGSAVDITESHHASAQLRLLLDSMGDGYFTLTPTWEFGFVNRRAGEILGRDPELLVGTNVWEEFPGAWEAEFGPQYVRALNGETVEFEAFYEGLSSWFEVRAHPLPSGIAVYFRDVTERRAAREEREDLLARTLDAQNELAHAARHDALTGLPNRTAFNAWLSHQGADAAAGTTAVLYIDLDRFKLVNDTLGHTQGDALLVEAARRLSSGLREQDFLARFGGDEFIVALTNTSLTEAMATANRLVDEFQQPFLVHGRRLMATASIGVALATGGVSPEGLVRDADVALYRAKDSGRNRASVFDSSLRTAAWQRLATETELRDALARRSISPHFQPIYDAVSGEVVGAEALARWDHHVRGLLGPSEFIEIAEDTGLIVDLGWQILDASADALPALEAAISRPDRCLWVNIVARQLDEPDFGDQLISWAGRRGVRGRIGLEITESTLVHDNRGARRTLERLAEHGFKIAIDDFGTGYSSLSRLGGFPTHLLKIDRSFVTAVDTSSGAGILRAIIELATSIGAKTCAEGVETKAQFEALQALGVDTLSGFYLCHPQLLDTFPVASQHGRGRWRHDQRTSGGGAEA